MWIFEYTCTIQNIQCAMTEINCVSDLRQVGDFLRVLPNKTDHHDITEILLKVALNTIKQTNIM